MTDQIASPETQQRALISWFAANCGGTGALGKTAIQKLIYAATEVKNIQSGYSFSLYTYGPYCKDLQADLDTADLLKAISIEYLQDQNRYIVRESENTESCIGKARDFIDKNSDALNWIAQNLGGKSARYLELWSTIHYIIAKEKIEDDRLIASRLMEIKPKFNLHETRQCIKEVRSLAFSAN